MDVHNSTISVAIAEALIPKKAGDRVKTNGATRRCWPGYTELEN